MSTRSSAVLTSSFTPDGIQVRMSEVIAALSYALDLTGGQPQGHASRSCLLGMRLARELRFDTDQSSALFYGLLLKDLGCSTNASKICYLFGADDRQAKVASKSVNLLNPLEKFKYAAQNVAPGGSLLTKVGKLAGIAMLGDRGAKELVEMRCERGAKIARDLQLPDATAAAIRALDEHWDGHGHPDNLKGEEIPLLARILGIAQTVEVFVSSHGIDAAYDMAHERRGTWFDPQTVDAFDAIRSDAQFWATFLAEDPRSAVSAVEPMEQTLSVDEAALDRIAYGFAQVIDAKSPWTFRHSEGVSKIATGLAETIGLSTDEVRDVRRAGLLHDVGKLGVSNLILDKPGKLDDTELSAMRKHTGYTLHILEQVAGFRHLASLAASHHERLDGKGYHRGIDASGLSTAARILGVADVYEALTAKRPYRQDLTDEAVMDIMTRNVLSGGLCPAIFDALKTYIARGGYAPVALAA